MKRYPYWTYWFLVWHQTRLPEDPWLGTKTGNGLCESLWMTSVSGYLQSHYQSVTQWIYHLRDKSKTSLAPNHWCSSLMFISKTLILSLPTVSMVSLSSISSWALGMSMCIRSVCCCLLIGSGGRVFLLENTEGLSLHKGYGYFFATTTWLWTRLPHEHLSQTFGICKIKKENICSTGWKSNECRVAALLSPLSLLSLCSRLLLLSISSPVKITAIPTNTQEIVTIIFRPSPPPDLWSLTFGAFTKGAMVPVEQ